MIRFELVEKYRITTDQKLGSKPGDRFGFFLLRINDRRVAVIADDGNADGDLNTGWEHVSVSLQDRCPTWAEMCVVKDLFWPADDWVLQYHPAKSDYVNTHPYVLHLWRPTHLVVPTPPKICV